MNFHLVSLIYVLPAVFVYCTAHSFKDITEDVFENQEYSGIVAAFGYFDSDKITDVFCLQNGGTKLEVLLGSEKKPYLKSSGISCSWDGTFISSVIPADFDGDSELDILVTLQHENDINEVKILWGSRGTVDCKAETLFRIVNQPFIIDFNTDTIPDIMGQWEEDHKRYIWLSNGNKNFTSQLIHEETQSFRNPHSSGLLDINNDSAIDFMIMGEKDMEVWYSERDGYNYNHSRHYPMVAQTNELCPVIGQSAFIDLNLDGQFDHIIPVCYDTVCKRSAILIWHRNKWVTLLDNFSFQDVMWGFKLPMGSAMDVIALTITLRAGDVNMDGYPDLITILQSKARATDVRAVILENVPCIDCPFGRTLEPQWNIPGLDTINGIQILSFYDMFEDGYMDIFASIKIRNTWKIRALKNLDSYDSYFMKVLVLSNHCSYNCSTNYIPFAPGSMVRYNMTKQDGSRVVSCAVQISQTAYFPLQLPYTVFGLGQTPNFIDALAITLPGLHNGKVRQREWLQIIPNSQMVVIPYPLDEENRWVKRLFVTPSHLVLLTCIALIATCIGIAMIVACLHWKERKEDKKEKMQDAHKFHFDAM